MNQFAVVESGEHEGSRFLCGGVMMLRVISFDLDGTLVTSRYVDRVWMEGVPEMYAQRYGLSLRAAKDIVISQYNKIGTDRLEWYDLQYWLNRFDLKTSKRELLDKYANDIELFPEVPDVLASLSKTYDLVITSNAAREFIEMEIQVLGDCFIEICSATSDFKNVKKSPAVFGWVCEKIDAYPSEVVHIGDHYAHDYEAAIKAGLYALYLDRKAHRSEQHIVTNLRDAEKRIQQLL